MLEQLRSAEVAAIRQLDDERGGEALDVAADEESPQLRLERAEIRAHLADAIRDLPERERQILSLYYEHELTLAEIGAVIGVGESRVSQLRSQAIARLRTLVRQSLRLAEVH
jgi:RNA polymerase sigma factor for flagellar operon FliA